MVSSLIFQKFSGEGLTEPPPQTPPPTFSRASPSVRASLSILGRFAPSTWALPSILRRFAPSIRDSPSTFDWGSWFGPLKVNSWIHQWERMMVRWMCGVSLKDRKRSVDLYSLFGVQSVAEVVRRGRLRWFGHVERKNEDD